MQWSSEENAGFTTGTPWIKVNPNYKKINAELEMADPDSVFNYYKKLIALRKNHEIIVYGSFKGLLEDSEAIYAYERQLEGKRLLVACNFSSELVACDLFKEASKGEELISNYKDHVEGALQPYEARVILFEN